MFVRLSFMKDDRGSFLSLLEIDEKCLKDLPGSFPWSIFEKKKD